MVQGQDHRHRRVRAFSDLRHLEKRVAGNSFARSLLRAPCLTGECVGKRPLSIDDKPMSLWHAARKQRDYRASPRSGPVVFHPFLSKKSSGKCKSLVGAAGGFPDPADGVSAQASDPRRGHHAECGEDLGAKAAGQRV